MIDVPEVIRTYLVDPGTDPALSAADATAAAALYALVGTRIWHTQLSAGFKNDNPAIVLNIAGGPGSHPTAPTQGVAVNFRCFGGAATFRSARAVYRALNDRLHKTAVRAAGGSEIIRADEKNPGQQLTDPETKWPYVFTGYEITLE